MNIIKRDEIEGESARARMRRLYKLGDVLGQGAFSIVRHAIYKPTGEVLAVKVIDRKCDDVSDDQDGLIEKEVKIISSLDHPNIIRLVEFMTSANFYYLVLEYCPGGELFDEIAKRSVYNEVDARDILKVLCTTIAYCHSKGVVHRDLKPENLLLTSDNESHAEIKISDFGLATTVGDSPLTEFCGTPDYMAPEIVNSKPYGFPVDMWAVGVITFCVLGGYLPFQEESEKALFQKISAAEFDYCDEEWRGISAEAKDFIQHLLTVDPEQRLTAEQALQHPWFQDDIAGELCRHDLSFSLSKIKASSAKKKFQAAGRAVVAANRMARLLSAFDMALSGSADEVDPEDCPEQVVVSIPDEGEPQGSAPDGGAAVSQEENRVDGTTLLSQEVKEVNSAQDEVRGVDDSTTAKEEEALPPPKSGCGCIIA